MIERMLALMAKEREAIRSGRSPRVRFIRDVVDFFRIFVDLRHHAKEESVLFRALRGKAVASDLLSMLDDFQSEHTDERKCVFCLKTRAEDCVNGNGKAATRVGEALDGLIAHASRHMAREERAFVHAFVGCFSVREAWNLSKLFREYDSPGHEDHYRSLVEKYENTEAETAPEAVLSNQDGNWYSEAHVLQASAG